VRRIENGHAAVDDGALFLGPPNRKSSSPDVAFSAGGLSTRFLEGAPVFAVEVRGEGDHGEGEIDILADKRTGYFSAGTPAVGHVRLLHHDRGVGVLRERTRAVGGLPPLRLRRSGVGGTGLVDGRG
jgi:hypothetical protein